MEGEGRGAKRGGFGDRGARGGRGGARGGRDGPRPGGPRGDRGDKDAWTPLTKLGRLVKYNHIKSLEQWETLGTERISYLYYNYLVNNYTCQMFIIPLKIFLLQNYDYNGTSLIVVVRVQFIIIEKQICPQSLEEIYTHSIPIKESQIVDELLSKTKRELSDEVMKIMSVQKQTKAGQRTRFKAIVAIGDRDGHVGLGVKLAKEVQIAIKGALVAAKLSLVPVRRGYWGNKIGNVHTVPVKVTGQCGSVRVRLIPAPRGTGIVGAPTSKKLLQFAGVEDVFTASSGSTKTLENFVRATYDALLNTYGFLTPDLWPKTDFLPSPFIRYADFLEQQPEKRGPRGDRPERGRGGRGGRGGFRGGDRPERTGDRPERTGDRPERGGERRGRGAPRGRGGPRREDGATPAAETAAE